MRTPATLVAGHRDRRAGRWPSRGVRSRIILTVSSSLSALPIGRRRQLAATLGLFAMLFVAVGAVAATGRSTAAVRAFSAVALVVAALLALIAWGVLHSVRVDLAEQRLDAAIEQAVRTSGMTSCDCGHEHDPNELHVTDACAHDGAGVDCTHTCETCVLTAMRPSPSRTRAERLPQ